MPNYYIGIDVGGTKVAYGVFNEKRELLLQDKHPSDIGWVAKTFIEDVAVFCESMIAKLNLDIADVRGIGIVLPGYIQRETGYIAEITNIPNLVDFYPVKMLEERIKIPVLLDNDANVAGLGEARTGAAKDFPHIVYMTVSTGIGGGIIIDKKIFHGSYGSAGEIGHLLITPNLGALCGCHNRGCIESYASARNMPQHFKKAIDEGRKTIMLDMAGGDLAKIDGKILEEAYNLGDELAVEHIDRMGYYLGILCYNLYQVLNINCYVIGGGLSFMGKPLFGRIEKTFLEFNKNSDRKVYFLPSKHKGDVGIYGAIELFFDK